MEKNILRQIFFDQHCHWDKFLNKHRSNVRSVVIKEIEKFRGCGDPKRGFKLLVCEGCHNIKRVPYRCKGRFCTTCSSGETEEWSRLLSEEVFQVNHRHVVFTIDERLREIFLKHREMLKEFMDEAVRIVQDWFEKKMKVTPGIIAGLHTFGARINFNPHIHMLVTMGGMKENGEWKSYDYLPFEMLRKQWQTVVLKLIRRHLSEVEKKKVQPLLQKAYTENREGFYIYGPRQKGSVREQLRYIGRYMRRPAIALHRIKDYDGETVTFEYQDKTDQKKKEEKISVEEFIARLIRQIPEEQFKVIRHYGVYSRRIKKVCKTIVAVWQETVKKWIVKVKKTIRRKNWSERIKAQTGKDPMICPECGNYFEYKGEVCLKEGQLTIKYAIDKKAEKCLERMISDLTGIKKEKARKEQKEKDYSKHARAEKRPKYRQLYLLGM